MKKVVSILLALIMCSSFIVGVSAVYVYEGAGDIELNTGIDLYTYDYEDDGTSYWYEWEVSEDYGSGEIEFSIYYGAFDWFEEQYCDGPEDYPAMLDYLRESYQDYGTVTDCTIDGYPAVVIEYVSDDGYNSADVFICGDVYFYVVELVFVEDPMTYDELIEDIKNMELNAEPGIQLQYEEDTESEENAESDNTSGSASMSPVVRNIIIIAVVAVVAIVCGTAVCVVVIVAVKGKKK